MFRAVVVNALIPVACCVVLAGCGPKRELNKVIVKGSVTYAGTPVANGDIKFYPGEGTKGPVSGASIKDGQYIIKNKDGVPIGTHTIQIRGFDVNREAATGDLTSGNRDSARVQYIPNKYNRTTELTREVTADTKTIDFDLEE